MKLINNKLLLFCALPLSTITAILLLIHYHLGYEFDGLFINIAAGIIGIIITIFYVDYILRQHEKDRWKNADKKVHERLKIHINSFIAGIRSGLGIEPTLMQSRALDDMHNEIIRYSEEIILPQIKVCINNLDSNGWKRLSVQISTARNNVINFLHLFQNRLSPEQMGLLFDLDDALSKSLIFYSTFPELAGIQDENQYRIYGCNETTECLKSVISICNKISQTI